MVLRFKLSLKGTGQLTVYVAQTCPGFHVIKKPFQFVSKKKKEKEKKRPFQFAFQIFNVFFDNFGYQFLQLDRCSSSST